MHRILILVAAAVLCAAGAMVALTFPSAARAYTPDQLPGLGYSVQVVNLTDGCHQWLAGYGNTAPKTDLGSDCDSGFQARLDTFVAATCPCAQPTTTTATTAPAATTTDAATTTTPAPPPAPTTTVVEPPPPPATTTVTVADPAVTDLQTRVSTLETQVADLTSKVDRLISGQTVTLASRSWTVTAAKDGVATLVAVKKRPGEKARPKRRMPSSVVVALLTKR